MYVLKTIYVFLLAVWLLKSTLSLPSKMCRLIIRYQDDFRSIPLAKKLKYGFKILFFFAVKNIAFKIKNCLVLSNQIMHLSRFPFKVWSFPLIVIKREKRYHKQKVITNQETWSWSCIKMRRYTYSVKTNAWQIQCSK